MLDHTSAHSLAFQALDQVLADGTVSPSSRRAMFSVVDELRSSPVSIDVLRRAESISVEFYKLECALQKRDDCARNAAIEHLKGLAVELLDWRIYGPALVSETAGYRARHPLASEQFSEVN